MVISDLNLAPNDSAASPLGVSPHGAEMEGRAGPLSHGYGVQPNDR